MSEQTWVDRVENFAKQREQIKEVLKRAGRPLHLGEICMKFIEYYCYLPKGIERRLRELVKNKEIICWSRDRLNRSIPHYKVNK